MSGCGWLTPFHLGVVKELQTRGLVDEQTTCAGTSGGALGALTMVSGICPDDALEAMIKFGSKPELHGDIEANMRVLIHNLLTANGKENAKVLQNCNNRLIIVVTRVWPEPTLKPLLIKNFESLPFLIDVVGASCFIPFWSASAKSTTKLTVEAPASGIGKDHQLVDGGFLAFMPPVGDVRISPFPRQLILLPKSKPHISLPLGSYSVPQLLSWVLKPAPEKILRELYQHGRTEAARWVDKQK